MFEKLLVWFVHSGPGTKRWFWRTWYNIFAKMARGPDFRFMNYGYAKDGFFPDLFPGDEIERYRQKGDVKAEHERAIAEQIRQQGFDFGGIRWKEYLAEAPVPQEDGTTVTRSFIPAAEAAFFPLGTRQTFRTFNGSPDYVGMANLPGEEFYSKLFVDPHERYVDVEAMMQTLPITTRPGVLVRGHTSN